MQVDSDEKQELVVEDLKAGLFRLRLVRPEFAPPSPEAISGILRNPQGWPGINSCDVEIHAPWDTEGR